MEKQNILPTTHSTARNMRTSVPTSAILHLLAYLTTTSSSVFITLLQTNGFQTSRKFTLNLRESVPKPASFVARVFILPLNFTFFAILLCNYKDFVIFSPLAGATFCHKRKNRKVFVRFCSVFACTGTRKNRKVFLLRYEQKKKKSQSL